MNAQSKPIVVDLDALDELRPSLASLVEYPTGLIAALPEFRHGDFSAGRPLLLPAARYRLN